MSAHQVPEVERVARLGGHRHKLLSKFPKNPFIYASVSICALERTVEAGGAGGAGGLGLRPGGQKPPLPHCAYQTSCNTIQKMSEHDFSVSPRTRARFATPG